MLKNKPRFQNSAPKLNSARIVAELGQPVERAAREMIV
jgi:hypothetical protein